MTGLKAIAQLELGSCCLQLIGELLCGYIGSYTTHQVVAREIQESRVDALCVDSPLLERSAVVHVGWNQSVVKLKDHLLIDQHVALARLMLELLHFFYKYLIIFIKFSTCRVIACNQHAPDKDLARF